MTDGREPVLSLREISKSFGTIKAVDNLSLELEAGEVLALLGPSGCGKTTTLRIVAGLERPTGGDVIYEGRPIVSVSRRIYVPTHQRSMGMVFQSYALWPHLTVFENVAYPLKLRGVGGSEMRDKAAAALAAVGLPGYEKRQTTQLSGGQQQRVALARALVYEPGLLLLDEPFSNLDASLRTQMRIELRILQRRLGMTCLFVTHDQTEALSLADRIAIMDEGHMLQIGSPEEVYQRPTSRRVRDFLGRSVAFPCRPAPVNGASPAVLIEGLENFPIEIGPQDRAAQGNALELSIRPEEIIVDRLEIAGRKNCVPGTIETLLYVGDHWESQIRISGRVALLELPRTERWREGERVALTLPSDLVQLWADS